MPGRIGEALLSADHDMMRIHRRVVQIGAIAAWLVAALFLILGFFTDDMSYYMDALGPILAASFMTALILARRENAGVALFGCAVVIVVMTAVAGDPELVTAGSLLRAFTRPELVEPGSNDNNAVTLD